MSSYTVKWICFILLVLSTAAQLFSFIAPYMVTNPYSKYFHDGIFYRCGAIQYLSVSRERVKALYGSEKIHIFEHIPISQQYVDKIIGQEDKDPWYRPLPGNCYWWYHDTFQTDQKSMRAVVLLAFISSFNVFLIYVFHTLSLFGRFRKLNFGFLLGAFNLLNSLIITGLIIAYTVFINGYSSKDKLKPAAPVYFTIDLLPLYFSWSYWILYGVAGVNLLISVIYFSAQFIERKRPIYYDEVYSGYLK